MARDAADDVRIRRVYDDAGPDDGSRILIDGLWPRGMRKDALDYDEWARDVAPSADLRRWFGHDPARFDEFVRRYSAELDAGPGHAAVDRIRSRLDDGPVTLLTATRDLDHSHAAVVAGLLREAR